MTTDLQTKDSITSVLTNTVRPFKTKLIVTRTPIAIGFDDIATKAWKTLFSGDVCKIDYVMHTPTEDAVGSLYFHGETVGENESANRIAYINKVMMEAAFVKLGARNGAFDFLFVMIEERTNAIIDVIGFYDCLITELDYAFLRFSGKALRSGEGDRYLAERYLAAQVAEETKSNLSTLEV